MLSETLTQVNSENMHKTLIFDQKIMDFFLPTYLPSFILDRYRKQTISFFRPNKIYSDLPLAAVSIYEII